MTNAALSQTASLINNEGADRIHRTASDTQTNKEIRRSGKGREQEVFRYVALRLERGPRLIFDHGVNFQ